MICQASGGPQKYTGKSMKEAHKDLKISEAEWEAMVKDFLNTLAKLKVPNKEQIELIVIVGNVKGDIVSAEPATAPPPQAQVIPSQPTAAPLLPAPQVVQPAPAAAPQPQAAPSQPTAAPQAPSAPVQPAPEAIVPAPPPQADTIQVIPVVPAQPEVAPAEALPPPLDLPPDAQIAPQ